MKKILFITFFTSLTAHAQYTPAPEVNEVLNPPAEVVHEFQKVQSLCDEKEAKGICDSGAFFFNIAAHNTGSLFYNKYTQGGWLMLQTEVSGHVNVARVFKAGLNLGLAYIPYTQTGPRLTYGMNAQVNITRWLYVRGAYYSYKLPEDYSQWQTNWRSLEVGINRASGSAVGFRYQWNGSGINTYGISSSIDL
jgi:hypothetical protein